jgi:hypothetical protein
VHAWVVYISCVAVVLDHAFILGGRRLLVAGLLVAAQLHLADEPRVVLCVLWVAAHQAAARHCLLEGNVGVACTDDRQ